MQTYCPQCRAQVQTRLNHECGLCAILVCIFIFGICTYCCSCFKDVGHSCPQCGAFLGRYKRLDCWFESIFLPCFSINVSNSNSHIHLNLFTSLSFTIYICYICVPCPCIAFNLRINICTFLLFALYHVLTYFSVCNIVLQLTLGKFRVWLIWRTHRYLNLKYDEINKGEQRGRNDEFEKGRRSADDE
jgi:lipopolysaccharide-induced tumor necrosis factor-alpha factor